MMLVEFVPTSLRGTSFGLMAFMENLSATASTSAVVWFDDWRVPYFFVGTLSILMSFLVKRYLVIVHAKGDPGNELKMTMVQMFNRVRQIPTFFFLVCQGLFGAIPWDMMGFLLLLMKWRGFTPEQVVSIQFASGCCGTVGSLIGGILGDHFSYLRNGRIYVALFSVLSGALFYGLFLHSESESRREPLSVSFTWSLLSIALQKTLTRESKLTSAFFSPIKCEVSIKRCFGNRCST